MIKGPCSAHPSLSGFWVNFDFLDVWIAMITLSFSLSEACSGAILESQQALCAMLFIPGRGCDRGGSPRGQVAI